MKKRLLIIAILIFVVAMLLGLGACSATKNEIEIQDSVVSRYGDGIAVLSSYAAPRTATEYKDVQRVKAKINIDTRMSGYHITGLYLPVGEPLTITVPSNIISNRYTVYINDYLSGTRLSKSISGVTTWEPGIGGVVEIYVQADETTSSVTNSSFNMEIEGGIVMPYYRLGRDSLNQIQQGNGTFAVLDCVNARFYVPTSTLYSENNTCKIDDIYNVLLWWQSAVSFINETLGIASSSRYYTSSVVFGDYQNIYYDLNQNVCITYAPSSYFEKTLFYSNLLDGEAWDLLYNICDYKTKVAGANLAGFIPQDSWVNILSAIDHVVMTNPSEDADIAGNEINWLHDSYMCLNGTFELLKHPTDELYQDYYNVMWNAFFINILHAFGLDKTIEIISEYRNETQPLEVDEFALLISSVLRSDMSMYFNMFPIMQISEETKNKMSGNQLYVPVQTKFTLGSADNTFYLGYTVAMGEKAVFDFGGNIVSLVDGWRVEKVVGKHSKLWSKDKENSDTYYYTPSQDHLIDEFDVTLTNGDHTVTLYGRINVVVTVATSKKYMNWTFTNPSTALAEAIEAYDKRQYRFCGRNPAGRKGRRRLRFDGYQWLS